MHRNVKIHSKRRLLAATFATLILVVVARAIPAAHAQTPAARSGSPSIDAWLGERPLEIGMWERSRPTTLDHIYLGDSIVYQVELENCGQAQPAIASTKEFVLKTLGAPQSHYVNINGVERQTVIYSYRLTPLESGTLTVPVATVTADGGELRGPTLTLDVRTQDQVEMKITVEPSSVVIMQPVTVTLSIYVKALSGAAQRDPIRAGNMYGSFPQLIVPWLDPGTTIAGAKPNESLNEWVNANANVQRRGFHLNNLVERKPMASGIGMIGPMVETPICVETEPKDVFQLDMDGTEVRYWRYDISRTFTAREVGEFEIGPAQLSGRFPIQDERGRSQYEQLTAIATPVKLTVRDVPAQGRPESYCGGIGQFNVAARLVPERVQLGDKMTLTLTITGTGSLDQIRTPDLATLPEIQDKFKIYPPSMPELDENRRVFTYSVKPERLDLKTFPSIPVSFYDINQQRYVTRNTPEFPIEVIEARRITVTGSGNHAGGDGSTVELSDGGIFDYQTNLSDLGDHRIRPVRWLAALIGLGLLYGLLVATSVFVRQHSSNVAGRRRRAAPSRARTRLADARRLAGSGSEREAAERVREAIVGLVADVIGVPEAAMTPGDVQHQLRQRGADEKVTRQTRELLEACDAARYGASDRSGVQLIRDGEQLLAPLAKTLRRAT